MTASLHAQTPGTHKRTMMWLSSCMLCKPLVFHYVLVTPRVKWTEATPGDAGNCLLSGPSSSPRRPQMKFTFSRLSRERQRKMTVSYHLQLLWSVVYRLHIRPWSFFFFYYYYLFLFINLFLILFQPGSFVLSVQITKMKRMLWSGLSQTISLVSMEIAWRMATSFCVAVWLEESENND